MILPNYFINIFHIFLKNFLEHATVTPQHRNTATLRFSHTPPKSDIFLLYIIYIIIYIIYKYKHRKNLSHHQSKSKFQMMRCCGVAVLRRLRILYWIS
jgi:hypothetical protein